MLDFQQIKDSEIKNRRGTVNSFSTTNQIFSARVNPNENLMNTKSGEFMVGTELDESL